MIAEVDRLPAGMLEQIIEDRQIARAIARYDMDPKASGALVDQVREIDYELAAAVIAARRGPC